MYTTLHFILYYTCTPYYTSHHIILKHNNILHSILYLYTTLHFTLYYTYTPHYTSHCIIFMHLITLHTILYLYITLEFALHYTYTSYNTIQCHYIINIIILTSMYSINLCNPLAPTPPNLPKITIISNFYVLGGVSDPWPKIL